ncbi:NDUFA12-domain-containing protein [Lactarius quietus]|nr:NDUFA12-domain-containing protein [Lactarius quietus]
MPSLARYIRGIRAVGIKEWWHQMQYIGDVKARNIRGLRPVRRRFGNRYFENLNAEQEVPGRHRWVDFAQHEYNATQVPAEWHSWLSHIRKDPPPQDVAMQTSTPSWKAPWVENLTGTRGAYRPITLPIPR